MRIAVITAPSKPSRSVSVMDEVTRLLSERGAALDMILPEERLIDVAEIKAEYDLYILKSSTEAALSLAGLLHASGARMINPYPTVALMKDKVIGTKILDAARVPLPGTYVAARVEQLASLLADGPLVVKPHWLGSQGRGVRIISSEEELDQIAPNSGILFAQRYHKPDGRDHKIYSIGERLFGVMRVWPARTYEEKLGEPFELSPEMSEIARRCGRAFGVDLFGLDIIVSEGKSYVVDINTFPGFKGVPDAALHLADYIYQAAARAVRGEPLVPAEIRNS